MPVITFPVGIDEYFAAVGGLKVVQRDFDLSDPRSYSETKGGGGFAKAYGTPLWYGSLIVAPMHPSRMRPLEARLRYLQRADAIFYIGDAMDDPAPAAWGTSFSLGAVTASNGLIRLDGLVPGTVVPAGTRFSFNYTGNRRAMHETLENSTANGSGQLTQLAVNPPILPGYTVGASVQIRAAARCAAMLPKDGVSTGSAYERHAEGFELSWRQTLRSIS